MSRNEARFPNAEDFIPERFFNDDGTLNENDPMDFVFGFGTCTAYAMLVEVESVDCNDSQSHSLGRYAADVSLFASIATMPATHSSFFLTKM